jgi:ATP-dependent Clp protease protease subunit
MINLMAKKKDSKKKKKKEEPVEAAPAVMSPAGTYMRENGVLFLTDNFDKETVSPLVKAITEYNLMPEELQPEKITLMINSPGGRVDSCLMLIDTMKMSSIPVNTFCTGLAASCGILTLMAGEHRMASTTAQIMSHQYAAGSSGKEHELYGRIKSFEHTSNWMETHYKHCTGLSIRKIRKTLLCPTDVWMDAEEALSYNIIDQVVNPYKPG